MMNTDKTKPSHILENEDADETAQSWANISHEIRAQIDIIINMTSLALKTELTGEQRGFLERTKNSADSLSELFKTVPCSRMKKHQRTESSQPVVHQPSAADPEKRLRILLAEDNLMNQKLVQTYLNMGGHEVITVQNGKEAVKAFEAENFDLILMDIQMPEMDGFEAVKIIRKTEAERKNKGEPCSPIPIVAMTAHEIEDARNRCLASGMDAYISKPVRRHEFLRTIERLTTGGSQVSERSDKIFDNERFLQSIGGNKILANKLITVYLENLPKLMSRIQQCIADNDSNNLKIEAHSLKGMSLNLSATSITRIALELERMGKADNLNRAVETYAVLEKEADALRTILISLTEKCV
jgi:CheY-like chemotaxis protein